MKTFKQNGKQWIVTEIKGAVLVMVQEVYRTKDSPTGWYRTGPMYYVNQVTGKQRLLHLWDIYNMGTTTFLQIGKKKWPNIDRVRIGFPPNRPYPKSRTGGCE